MAHLPTHHIEITTTLQNNCHSDPSAIELSGILASTELKKPHPSRLVGGAGLWKGTVPHPGVVDKNLGGISQGQGVPAPHQALQPRVPVPGR